MSGGQNYVLPAMDMAKVGGPLSVVKVCTFFAQIYTSHVHSPLLDNQKMARIGGLRSAETAACSRA